MEEMTPPLICDRFLFPRVGKVPGNSSYFPFSLSFFLLETEAFPPLPGFDDPSRNLSLFRSFLRVLLFLSRPYECDPFPSLPGKLSLYCDSSAKSTKCRESVSLLIHFFCGRGESFSSAEGGIRSFYQSKRPLSGLQVLPPPPLTFWLL